MIAECSPEASLREVEVDRPVARPPPEAEQARGRAVADREVVDGVAIAVAVRAPPAALAELLVDLVESGEYRTPRL